MTVAAKHNCIQNIIPSWSDQFLSWFAEQGFPMFEYRRRLGELDYFHFSSSFTVADGRKSRSFGSSVNRKLAAIKCAAEAIERITMVQYFTQNENLPRGLRNSNGWAVHSEKETAKNNARLEAIERHLLLRSYALFGWEGFQLIHSAKLEDITLKFLKARCTTQGFAAGMVLAQSQKFKGVSFGYTAGGVNEIYNADFWQSAIYEAVGKLSIQSINFDSAGQSWMRRENNRLLCEPFDLSAQSFSNIDSLIECNLGNYSIEVVDIGFQRGLNFPLFAAYASGGNLIPLFWKSELDELGNKYVKSILNRNGITEIPERHPIV